ncbi:hypothetical protein K6M89_10400 [Rhizobium sp. 13T]|uniref:Uncharacterized protein n=1 Tax=Rhizobium croatiense TaxID=2867516 RepID=A0ABS7LXZ0_9HYPH|nr:hypothetical protein [Rhizobium croatiense]
MPMFHDTAYDCKGKLGQTALFPRGAGQKSRLLPPAFAAGVVSVEFVHGLGNIRNRRERYDQAERGKEAMKASPGAIDKERADAIDQHDRRGEDQHLQRSVASGASMPWAR